MTINTFSGRAGQPAIVAVSILTLVALVYWPVIHAGFVWDDIIVFQQMSWLTEGNEWRHYIFRGFNYWTYYFRPLVVALFTAEVRLFDDQPAAMHAVSLCMHLVNTLLIGLIAWISAAATSRSHHQKIIFLACSMLLYGLHPVLIEAVTWIGCQFDLMATMFMLLGIMANTLIRPRMARAISVGTSFFLSACCKESAVAFPAILAIHSWITLPDAGKQDLWANLRSFLHRHWKTFAALLVAGLAYLAFRRWALGQLVPSISNDAPSAFGRYQEVCFLYLHYWRTLFIPMPGMNPIHFVDTSLFGSATPKSVLTDILATTIVLSSLYLGIARRSALACIVLAVTAAMLPVLHVVPTAFDASLYHERYVLTGLAIGCAMLPLVRVRLTADQRTWHFASRAAAFLGVIWLAASTLSIRTTVPLWSSNIGLWEWALTLNPKSLDTMNNLLSAYISKKDYGSADALLEKIKASGVPCTICALNAANMALERGKPSVASGYLEEAKKSEEVANDRVLYGWYMLATGKMLLQQDNVPDAVDVLRASIEATPSDPQPRLFLARALAAQGRLREARSVSEVGIAMLPANRRPAMQRVMDALLQQSAEQAR